MVECADLLLSLHWESEMPSGRVRHSDHLFASSVDIEKDVFPLRLKALLLEAVPGQTIELSVTLEDLVMHAGVGPVTLPRAEFAARFADGTKLDPQFGRFYPANWFPNSDRRGWLPTVRCTAASTMGLTVDARHPLLGRSLSLATKVVGVQSEPTDRMPIDWLSDLSTGPGMQAYHNGQPTSFLDGASYRRPEEAPDPVFYATARIAAHIDSRAQRTVGAIYRNIIPEDGMVLDLMSSVHSNLADDQKMATCYGLGLNGQEMSENPVLSSAVLADLNADRVIPFVDDSFDAAICTVSIDYLTDPVRIVDEVARVLRPGAAFAVSFSNRWFPPKVTKLWTELHPFEQMALVVQYFEASGSYVEIETRSYRGYPRPMDDPYHRQIAMSDPIFAVIGRVVG